MNFQKEYQNDLDQITADESAKRKTRSALRKKRTVRSKKHLSLPVRAMAVSLCGILFFSVGLLLLPKKGVSTQNGSSANVSEYTELYKTIQKLIPKGGAHTIGKFAVNEKATSGALAKNSSVDGTLQSTDSPTTNFSETTKQVDGVDEGDIVKTDGQYIYQLARDNEEAACALVILDARESEPEKLCHLDLFPLEDYWFESMYVLGDRLVLLGNASNELGETKTILAFYDITNRNKPTLITQNFQSGDMTDSRMIGDTLYVISNFYVGGNIRKKDVSTYVPSVKCNGKKRIVPANNISVFENCQQPAYTVACVYTAQNGVLSDTKSVLGGTYAVYCNTENLIAAGYEHDGKTQLVRFSLKKKQIKTETTGKIPGTLLNQFSMDEFRGFFRFVTTRYNEKNGQTVNVLTVLNSDFKQTGKLDNIAPGEQVYSVRFMGDVGYFVTFRQVDPLFSVDLSNPTAPQIIGDLKIPGFSDYLFPYGEDKLLGIGKNADEDTGKAEEMKLSLFDISDPSEVSESFKTDVPAFDSEALYNHKACMADAGKNLIGFSGYHDDAFSYFLYTLREDGFALLAEIPVGESDDCRGLYVGETFYVVTSKTLFYFDYAHPDAVQKLSLS